MLSLTKGREIALFTKGKNFKGKKVYLSGEHDFRQNQKSENEVDAKDKFKLLKPAFFEKNKINKTTRKILKDAFENETPINSLDEKYQDILHEMLETDEPIGN